VVVADADVGGHPAYAFAVGAEHREGVVDVVGHGGTGGGDDLVQQRVPACGGRVPTPHEKSPAA